MNWAYKFHLSIYIWWGPSQIESAAVPEGVYNFKVICFWSHNCAWTAVLYITSRVVQGNLVANKFSCEQYVNVFMQYTDFQKHKSLHNDETCYHFDFFNLPIWYKALSWLIVRKLVFIIVRFLHFLWNVQLRRKAADETASYEK